MFTYRGEVKAVIDAYTIDVLIDLGFGVHTMQRLRLYGIDAPEMKTEAGKIAKEYVKSVLLGGDAFRYVYVRTLKDKKDKYGRKLAVLYFDESDMIFEQAENKLEMMQTSFNCHIVANGTLSKGIGSPWPGGHCPAGWYAVSANGDALHQRHPTTAAGPLFAIARGLAPSLAFAGGGFYETLFTSELMMASTFDLMDGRYTACDTGEIYSNLSGRMLSPGRNSKGYYTVQLYDGSVPKKPKSHLVHRLICTAFHGEPPLPNSQVNHKDGNKANNAASNLEWTTPLENVRHGIEVLGKAQFGEKSSRCKIAADKMPIMMDRNLSCAEAGRRLGCSGAYVSQVRRGLYRTQG